MLALGPAKDGLFQVGLRRFLADELGCLGGPTNQGW